MFRPMFLFIGLRYTFGKSRHHFISLIALVSTLGIAIGVAVLITVLSVVNGFDKEIKNQIFALIPPITIQSAGKIAHWQSLQQEIKQVEGITGVAPFVSNQVMVVNGSQTLPVMLMGVLPAAEKQVSAIDKKMITGQLSQLRPNHNEIIIGKELAEKLKIQTGETINVVSLNKTSSLGRAVPHFQHFKVVGIFKAGGGALNFDAKLAFTHLSVSQAINHFGDKVSGFHVNVADLDNAPLLAVILQNTLSPVLGIWDWTEQLGDFFENIRLTKTIMFFIFVLIIAVAVFNLICTMVMVVKNKQTDIAILRTLGATPFNILMIFIVEGITIALWGTLLGVMLGLVLAANISTLSTWIQTLMHTELISANIYFVDYLPSDLQWLDVGVISLMAILLSLIAILLPAWNASKVNPAESLK